MTKSISNTVAKASSKASLKAAQIKAETVKQAAIEKAVLAAVATMRAKLQSVRAELEAVQKGAASSIRAIVIETASLPAFAKLSLAQYNKGVMPIMREEIDAMPLGKASKAVYLTGARTLFLAKSHGLAIGAKVSLSVTGNLVDALRKRGVLPETAKGAPAKPEASKAVAPSKRTARQQAAAKAGTVKSVTQEDVLAMLRLLGFADRSEALAHMLLNERSVVTKWLDHISAM